MQNGQGQPDRPHRSPLQAGLYVVATPLGNLGDITLRGKQVLAGAACIACEDTRMTRELLRLLDIAPPMLVSVREHNEREAASGVVSASPPATRVAYVSDAGTPAISDPGARLVAPSALRVSDNSDSGRERRYPPRCRWWVNDRRVYLSLVCADVKGALTTFVEAIAARDGNQRLLRNRRTGSTRRCWRWRAVLPPGASRRHCRSQSSRLLSALSAGAIGDWLVSNAERLRGEFVVVVAGADQTRASIGHRWPHLLRALPGAAAAVPAKVAAKLSGEDRETLYALAVHEIWPTAFQCKMTTEWAPRQTCCKSRLFRENSSKYMINSVSTQKLMQLCSAAKRP